MVVRDEKDQEKGRNFYWSRRAASFIYIKNVFFSWVSKPHTHTIRCIPKRCWKEELLIMSHTPVLVFFFLLLFFSFFEKGALAAATQSILSVWKFEIKIFLKCFEEDPFFWIRCAHNVRSGWLSRITDNLERTAEIYLIGFAFRKIPGRITLRGIESFDRTCLHKATFP